MYFYCDVCFVFVQVSTLQAIRTNCFSSQLLFPSCVCLSPGIDTKTHLSLFKSKGLEHGLKAGLQVQVQVHIQAEIQVGRSVKSKSEQFINEEWFLQCLWSIQFRGKFSCGLDTKGISIICRLTRVGWSKFGLSSACQPRIPFDGKYVYWAYPSRMASLAGAVNDQWDSPMLGSFRLKGIWKSICSRIWNLLSKVAVSSVCIEAKGKREGERALWSVHWPGHCTPVSASDSTRLHRGGRVFERMRNNTTELPAAAAFPQALFLYCCGQTSQATNMTWHCLKNSSNNHLFICFALLISSDLVYILDSGLRRVGRNFGEEELQILTYIWKFES